MAENPTFGCGTFLPGFGPGNFPEFDGGGTIDSGGGDPGPGPSIPPLEPSPPEVPTGPVQPGPSTPGPVPPPGNPPPPVVVPGTGGGGAGQPGGGPQPPSPPSPGPASPAPPGGGGGGGGGGGTPVTYWKCSGFPDYKCTSFTQDITVPPGGGAYRTQADCENNCNRPPESGPNDDIPGPAPGGGGGGIPVGPQNPFPGGGTVTPGGGDVFGGNVGTFEDNLAQNPGEGLLDPGDNDLGGNVGTLADTLTPSVGGGLIEPSTPPTGNGNVGTNVDSLVNAAMETGEIDLNDPTIIGTLLEENPMGLEDADLAFDLTPPAPTIARNTSRHTELFNKEIDSNIEYVLSNQDNTGNWNSNYTAGVTPDSLYRSLKPEVRTLLEEIRNYDGTPLNKNQIFSMIGSRVLDGTLDAIPLRLLRTLAEDSKSREPVLIKRSVHDKVNEIAAVSLIERDMFSLDVSNAKGNMQNILPNWKTLASDTDKRIDCKIDGEIRQFYLNDDDTFIERSSLSIHDGDCFKVKRGDKTYDLFVKSEKDHAFLLPERTRQKAINLLGGDSGRTLEVSASILSNIEFNYSLTATRQPYYMLSCVLSSITTKPSPTGSFLLKDTTARYELADTVTDAGLAEVNAYIKYKANNRVFLLDDEDIILDYIEDTSSLTMKQTDILFDSPKVNKTIPLLTRQIPWYIIVYPTNRSDLNIFNSKSQIVSMETSGTVIRQLRCRTSIVPNLSKEQTNKFVRLQTNGRDATDVWGNPNTQARITQITPGDKIFTTGYREGNDLVSASTFTPARKKTGLRLLKEIITEMDDNYLLGFNGIGKSVTEHDVFSRLYFHQFNRLLGLENFPLIRDSIRNGIFSDVKVVPPIKSADKRINFFKSLLVQRKAKAAATTDTFQPIKSLNTGEQVVPPTTTEPPTKRSTPR